MPEQDLTEVVMDRLPDCDLCKQDPVGDRATTRRYDARLRQGSWAYLCHHHFETYGVGLGLGRGQEIITPERRDAQAALDRASVLYLADPENEIKQDAWLECHRRLTEIIYPEAAPISLADRHPMRNHPAYKALQARLAEENKP